MEKVSAEKKQKKPRPWWVKWAVGYVGVLLFAVGLVYYWRVAFMLTTLPVLPATLLAAAIGSVLYLAAFLICRYGKNQCLQAALCVFVLGALFCFFTAPLQVPDENRHFLRAYAVSEGRFNYDYERGYPNDVNLLVEQFDAAMNHRVTYDGGQLAPVLLAQYEEKLSSGQAAATAQPEPVQFMVWPYLFSAAGMALARLFGFSALGILYAGRLGNLLLYAIISYFTFRNCSKYRGVFYAVALLPLSLSLAASCSFDGLMLALCYLAASYFCKDEIRNLDVIVFAVAVAGATVIKPVCIVLAALLLLIPESRWKNRLNPWLAVGGILAVGLIAYFGLSFFNNLRVYNYPAPVRGTEVAEGEMGANVGGQVAFVLSNPLAFLARLVNSFFEEKFFLFNLGQLGTLDLALPVVSGLSLLSLSAASALGIQQKEDTKYTGAIALGLAALLYAGAAMLGIYVTDSHVGSALITGLQPRYFLPAILLLFMLFSILLGKAVRPRLAAQGTMERTEKITLAIAAGVALVAAVLLFESYFVGQWIPKGEGGYKLINLFGWQIQ